MMGLEIEQRDQFPNEEDRPLSLRDMVRVIVSHLWSIVIVVIVLTGMVLGFSLAQTPQYEASVKILVSPKQGGDATLSDDVMGLQQLIQTLTEGADTRPTADAVIERLNLETTPERLLDNLEAQQLPETQYIQVSYEDPSPQRARLIANTSGKVLSEFISEGKLGSYVVTAKVFEPATTPTDPVSPNIKLNVFLALVVGVALGIALAFILESLGVGTDRKEQHSEARPALGPRPVRQ
jgi:capsular polysaccharide biosynthesis protein